MSSTGQGWHRSSIVTRWEELQADLAQERELARLEAKRIGRVRAEAQLAQRVRAERQWFQVTNTRYRLRTTDDEAD